MYSSLDYSLRTFRPMHAPRRALAFEFNDHVVTRIREPPEFIRGGPVLPVVCCPLCCCVWLQTVSLSKVLKITYVLLPTTCGVNLYLQLRAGGEPALFEPKSRNRRAGGGRMRQRKVHVHFVLWRGAVLTVAKHRCCRVASRRARTAKAWIVLAYLAMH